MGRAENSSSPLSPRDRFLVGEHLTNVLRTVQDAIHQKLLKGETTDIDHTTRLATTAIKLTNAITREEQSLSEIAGKIPAEDESMQQYLTIWKHLKDSKGLMPVEVVCATENLAKKQLGLYPSSTEAAIASRHHISSESRDLDDQSSIEFPEIISPTEAPYTLVIDLENRTATINGHEKRFSKKAKLVTAVLEVFARHPGKIVPNELLEETARSVGFDRTPVSMYGVNIALAFQDLIPIITGKPVHESPKIVEYDKKHKGYYLNANASFTDDEEKISQDHLQQTQEVDKEPGATTTINDAADVFIRSKEPEPDNLSPDEIFLNLLENDYAQIIDPENAAYDVSIFTNSSRVALNNRRTDAKGFIHTPTGRLFLLHAAFAGRGIPEKDLLRLMMPIQRQMGLISVYRSIQHSFHSEIRHTTGKHYSQVEPILAKDEITGKYFMNARVSVINEQGDPIPNDSIKDAISSIIKSKQQETKPNPLPVSQEVFSAPEKSPTPETESVHIPLLSTNDTLYLVNALFDAAKNDEANMENYDLNSLTIIAGKLQLSIERELEDKKRRDEEYSLISVPRRNKNKQKNKEGSVSEAKLRVLRTVQAALLASETNLIIPEDTPELLLEAFKIARDMNRRIKGGLLKTT